MFTFKGISTKDMRIIVEELENLIAKAPLKHEVLNIEGRDDAIYYPLGYAPIEISLTLQLLDPSKIDEVLMWLNGEGELIYKNRKTKARIYSEIQPIRTSGIRIINIEVIRSPFWYALEDDYSEAWGANLIPNGWDSFKPYGSGKNYVENWDFTDSDVSQWFDYYSKNEIKDNILRMTYKSEEGGGTKYVAVNTEIPSGNSIILRMKYRTNCEHRARVWGGVKPWPEDFLEDDGEWHVYEFETETIADKQMFRFYNIHVGVDNKWLEVDWIQITPVDNQHLVVEKTPLENGLTRIQTWGGNDRFGWRLSAPVPKINNRTYSFYIENNGSDIRMADSWNASYELRINKGTKEFIKGNLDNRTGYLYVANFRNSEKRLDFIASTPTIVEGDTPPTWEADENPRIINEGTAPSKPLIKLTKGTTNTCEFEVNGVYFKYHFNNDDHVLIDCDKMEASDNGQLRNRHLTIGFEFPVLEPGPNVVKRISGDAKIEFSRKDRWL